jgi:hypothetical protein
MTSTNPSPDPSGCSRCWPADPGAAREAMLRLRTRREIVDESHFRVAILGCRGCGQHFVYVFTETIDWAAGDDAQRSTLMPITDSEARALRAGGAEAIEDRLFDLAPARRSLRHDHPTGGSVRLWWGSGILVGPHD